MGAAVTPSLGSSSGQTDSVMANPDTTVMSCLFFSLDLS